MTARPWVYIEKEEGLYQRRSVDHGMPTTGGVFVELTPARDEQTNLAVGDKLVVQGAQMLLSEEFSGKLLMKMTILGPARVARLKWLYPSLVEKLGNSGYCLRFPP
ncbi:MAG: hypothetical protein Q9N32_08130 [Gammaproteobacteria bacterium]|nr:hypothetical protein [Gammaproteobacteria bacterium]